MYFSPKKIEETYRKASNELRVNVDECHSHIDIISLVIVDWIKVKKKDLK